MHFVQIAAIGKKYEIRRYVKLEANLEHIVNFTEVLVISINPFSANIYFFPFK